MPELAPAGVGTSWLTVSAAANRVVAVAPEGLFFTGAFALLETAGVLPTDAAGGVVGTLIGGSVAVVVTTVVVGGGGCGGGVTVVVGSGAGVGAVLDEKCEECEACEEWLLWADEPKGLASLRDSASRGRWESGCTRGLFVCASFCGCSAAEALAACVVAGVTAASATLTGTRKRWALDPCETSEACRCTSTAF